MRFDFLLSTERSGSNLFTRIINSHTKICGPPPSHMIRTFVNNICKYGNLDYDFNWKVLTEDLSEFLGSQLGVWQTKLTPVEIQKLAPSRSIAGLVRAVYTAEAKANNKSRVFIKENQAAKLIPFYLAFFKDCKFVHLVRDPRDMALSWKLSSNHPGSVMRAAGIWSEEQRQALFLHGCLKGGNRVMTVRYEDILTSPKSTLEQVCYFLEIDFEEQMLEFHSNNQTVNNAKRIKDWANLAKPVLKNNHKKYVSALSQREVLWVESVCGLEMERFGYNLDHKGKKHPDGLEEDLMNLENNISDQKQERRLIQFEREIRAERLAVINKIISRKLPDTPLFLE